MQNYRTEDGDEFYVDEDGVFRERGTCKLGLLIDKDRAWLKQDVELSHEELQQKVR
jgi:hypothetical protein